MKSFTLITALVLCNRSWISATASDFQTVEVQLGEEATLQCSNISTDTTQTEWFRVVNRAVNRAKPSCVSSMYGSESEAFLCDGFQNGRFNMSSNITFVFLKIKRVDFSDAGLYFCGFYIKAHTVISSAIELRIQGNETSEGRDFETEKEPVRRTNLTSITLGGLTGLLTIVVIILVVKTWMFQKAGGEQEEHNKNVSLENLNYAALNFQKKAKRSRERTAQRELEPHVVYAATR